MAVAELPPPAYHELERSVISEMQPKQGESRSANCSRIRRQGFAILATGTRAKAKPVSANGCFLR